MNFFWAGLLPVLAIVLLAGVFQTNSNKTKQTEPVPRDVLAVGDSLQHQMKEELQTELGLKKIILDHRSKPGANSTKIYRLVKKFYRPSAHSVIIFDAGTNDNPVNPSRLEINLARVAQLIGSDRCLIVPTVNSVRIGSFDSPADKNQIIQDFASERANTFTPNWSKFILKNPELLRDRLHPNEVGDVVRARILTRAVEKCFNG